MRNYVYDKYETKLNYIIKNYKRLNDTKDILNLFPLLSLRTFFKIKGYSLSKFFINNFNEEMYKILEDYQAHEFIDDYFNLTSQKFIIKYNFIEI